MGDENVVELEPQTEASGGASPTPSVPEKYKKLQKEWKTYELIWSAIHYFLGITATILAFLASSKDLSTVANQSVATALIMASGALAVVLTFLTPASRRKAYTEACDILRIARIRYETEGIYTPKDLNDVIEKAQQIIAKR